MQEDLFENDESFSASLRRYYPDQVPRVCGMPHSQRKLPQHFPRVSARIVIGSDIVYFSCRSLSRHGGVNAPPRLMPLYFFFFAYFFR